MKCLCEVDFNGFGARCQKKLGHKGAHVWTNECSIEKVGETGGKVHTLGTVEVRWTEIADARRARPR